MNDIIYNQNSILIVIILFVAMLIAIESGYRLGVKSKKLANPSYKSHIESVQSSLLGILALLIAFTFSIALQRFDSRSEAVVDEANSIGTAFLRAQLLPIAVRQDVQKALHQYIDIRVQSSTLPLDHTNDHLALRTNANDILNSLWQLAIQAAEIDQNPVTTGLFIQSLNELIDSFGRRTATVDRHVPEAVLMLLSIVFIATGCVVGYSVGITNNRPSNMSYLMVGLIVLLVFIIIDLDHPRRGLIRVSQNSLTDLKASIHKDYRQALTK